MVDIKDEKNQTEVEKKIIYDDIDYKNLGVLKKFISESGRINPRRTGGISSKDYRKITKAIKIARQLALLPYCDNHKKS